MSSLVTLAEVKNYIQIAGTLVDTRLQGIVDEVEAWVAECCGTAFAVTSKTENISGGFLYLRPSIQPLVAVTKVTDRFQEDGELDDDYYRKVDDVIEYIGTGYVPTVWSEGLKRWEVQYTGGYNNGTSGTKPTGSVAAPAGMKLGVLDFCARVWKARGGLTQHGAGTAHESLDELLKGEIAAKMGLYSLKERVN